METQKNKKLIIIDGTSILNDCYHRTLTQEFSELNKGSISKEEAYKTLLKSVDGKYINAIQGFLRLFFELVDTQKPSHLVVVWGTFRKTNCKKDIYSKYKSTSEDIDEPLLEQFSTIKDILSKAGIVQYSSHKYESLDLIGSLAKEFHKDIPVTIFARNTNILQLANLADILLERKDAEILSQKFDLDLSNYPKNYVLFNEDLIKKVTGLYFDQIVDYKAILGNSSTNVPGVKGIGKDTIVPLLQHYYSLEELYIELKVLKEDELNDLWETFKKDFSLKRNPIPILLKHKEDVYLSKKLVTINTNILTSIVKNNKNLNIDSFKNDINIKSLVSVLQELNLTPITTINNRILSKVSNLSSLIQTYSPRILSPLSEDFVGDNIEYIKNIDINNENCPIHLPKLSNIVDFDKYKSVSIGVNSSHNHNNSSKEEDSSQDESTIILPSETVMTTQTSNTDMQTNDVAISEHIIEKEDIADGKNNTESFSSIDSILNTLPKDSNLLNILNNNNLSIKDLDKDSLENVILNNFNCKKLENSNTKVRNDTITNQEGLELIETFTVNKYKCPYCNSEFLIVNSTPKYCIHCGHNSNDSQIV